ncbi:S9 family peptidase [Alteromonas sp. ASW11-19]|uniref:S9 family peptidase n=1 Tax=Alteromonas salexigens TaxID=2982530 RepID=A0ABT2VR31_9ALTE|nr:S9 family peptidase [Alteromonas salexigens]MCU7555766.1 S9 family peptidase [Alteromonas salexigens]
MAKTAATLSVDDFIAKPGLVSASLSPDGKHLATVWNEDDRRVVVVLDLKQNKIKTKFGDNVIRPYHVSWANNERLLVKLRVPYGTEGARRDAERNEDFDLDDYFMFGRIVSTNIDGTGLVKLLNDERSAERVINLARIQNYLPADPEHVLMSSYRLGRRTLYKVNVNTGKSEMIASAGSRTVAFITSEEGKVLFRYDYKRIAHTIEIFNYTQQQDWLEIEEIYFNDEDADRNSIEIKDLVGVKDDALVYRKKNPETGFHELITIVDGEKQVLVSLPDTDIVGVVTNGYRNEVIGYTVLTDVYRSRYFDKQDQDFYDAISSHFEGENFVAPSTSENNELAILVSWGMNNPGSYFIYDHTQHQIKLLSYAYTTLPEEHLARGTKIQYQTRDGHIIDSYILLPPDYNGSQAMPTVVLPHGGPQHRDYMGWDDFAQFIATRGYIVVKPNFRGSTGYGKEHELAGYKEWGGKMQEDLEDVVRFLVANEITDPDRVCMVGLSYGGYAALMGTVKTPELFRCAVSINGVTHLSEQVEYDLDKFETEKIRTYIKNSIGHPEEDKAMLHDRSPALHAATITTPILLVHGEEDNVVPYDQAQLMRDALEENNKPVEFIPLEETGHCVFCKEENVKAVYEKTEAFLQKHAPVKTD